MSHPVDVPEGYRLLQFDEKILPGDLIPSYDVQTDTSYGTLHFTSKDVQQWYYIQEVVHDSDNAAASTFDVPVIRSLSPLPIRIIRADEFMPGDIHLKYCGPYLIVTVQLQVPEFVVVAYLDDVNGIHSYHNDSLHMVLRDL